MTDTTIPQPRILPANITSYDLMKAAAVVIMIIDHFGYYFDGEQTWWRAIGRIGFPVWFFLIGYARGRDFSAKLWIGGAVLIAANIVAGQSIFPLNALFSMIIIRALLDPVMKFAMRDIEMFMAVCVLLVGLVIPSFLVCEYGAQGFLMAMFGYVVRNRPAIGGIRNTELFVKLFTLFSFTHFFVIQSLFFGLDLPQMIVMAAGLVVVCNLLYEFRPLKFPRLTNALPWIAAAPIRFMGRHTLEIYVAHLVLFKFAGMILEPARFPLLHWTWFMI